MTLLKSPALKATLLFAGWLLAGDSLAWSIKGHAQIAEAAFGELTAIEQTYFEQQAAWLIKKERAKKWRKSLAGYSDFAKISVWPDTRRELTLEQLFERFRTPLPAALSQYASQNTYRWHYVNAHFHRQKGASRCRMPASGELIAVWLKLIEAYRQGSEAQRAIVLAFIVHLLADANQPLHTMAALNKACESDAGGNGFCLQHKGGRCELNLHQLWDRGFGVFDGSNTITANASSMPSSTAKLARWSDYPEVIAKSSIDLASPIYNLKPNALPPKHYSQWAEQTVRLRAGQAAGDLAALLRELYEYTH